jgi:Outer membrane protein beta-barrel domain
MRPKILMIAIVFCFVCPLAKLAQAQFYAGVLGGLATLSGDNRSLLSPGSTAFSSYGTQNGPAVEVVFGRHLSDYFTVQGNYIWNRNKLTLTSVVFSNGVQQSYQELRSSSQRSALVDLLVYFRRRSSRLRPYLSVGTGLVHLYSSQQQVVQLFGTPSLPPQNFSANVIALHVPVGIDVKLVKGWSFRYTFSETLSQNPISKRLSPQGQGNLKNFQNLFGLVLRF